MLRSLVMVSLLILTIGVVAGCGSASTPPCVAVPELAPATASLDHAAAAPLNQITYGIGERVVQGNCPVAAHLVGVEALAVSDPVHVQVTTTPNGPAVVACVGATDGPVTVTAGTLTAQLTCR